ncbi:MAG: helix-turn-helix transcriptional regulator [Oscillospiraceae bacterium]|nr:helix-turn-helix transcriptional regulator [Oscillospiraceae bacterium]
MNQIKIGKFIAERRKAVDLTQMQLAEKLNVTDRAVSKWETGRSLPDSSIMLELCEILKITVNDLLSGEVVTMDNYNKEMENNLLEMVKQKERADKHLLALEIVVGLICVAILFALAMVASFVEMEEWLRILLILIGLAPIVIATPFMLKIEQTAGYYECNHCKHRYVPEYNSVLWAPHMGRTRHMKCPNCHKKSWQKKVLSKD